MENPIVAVVNIEKTYHRIDECLNKRFCSDSGLKLRIKKVLKGNPPNKIDATKAIYTSCYSGIYHPYNGTIDIPDGDFVVKGYENNQAYLVIIDKIDDSFVVMAGVLESESLDLQKKIEEVN